MEDKQVKQSRITIEATSVLSLEAIHDTIKAIRSIPGVLKAELAHVAESPEFIPFETQLKRLLNAHSKENGSNTPDFLLASYLKSCLDTWNQHVKARDEWHGIEPRAGGVPVVAQEPDAR